MSTDPQDPRVEILTETLCDAMEDILTPAGTPPWSDLEAIARDMLARDLLSRLDAVGKPVADGFVEREELENYPDPWPLDDSPGLTVWADDEDPYADMIPVTLYCQGGEGGRSRDEGKDT